MTADNARMLAELEETARVGAISHLPHWDRFSVDAVVPAANALLDEAEETFASLETGAPASWEGLMAPLERLQLRIGALLGAVNHLLSVKYSDALQEAYDQVRPRFVAFSNRMSQSRPVYDAMCAIRDGEAFAGLSAAQRRILTESIRAMERSGVHLTGEARARYEEIQQRLSTLANDFQTHLVKEEQVSHIEVSDAAEVEGVPDAILAAAARTALEDGVQDADTEAGPWHFVVNGVNYTAVIQHARHRGLRERFYRAFKARGTSDGHDNRPVLEEILRLRQEEARLVGFENYAALSIDAKMAASTDEVWSLLRELEAAARPAGEADRKALETYQAEHKLGERLLPWDVSYLSELLRRERYDYDSEVLRAYFQMPRVLEGLYSLTERLYNVQIRQVPQGSVPVWDESVTFYEVVQDGEIIAGFYVDPYARPGEKRGGAWMNTVVGRSRVLAEEGRSSSLPVALFVMNGRPPEDDRPALMSLDEVRTLFHEFGHATQHMFTDIEEGGASGMNLVEWDAVELASQFNEYWMEYRPFLKAMTAHVETGEPLDDGTIDRILASRNFMAGSATLRQLLFAKVDLTLHERYGLPGENGGESPFEIERRIAAETVVMPMLEDESQLPAFSHLFAGGYAAGYYSYKWAEVLAADAFAAFREVGLDNEEAVAEVAARFRRTVLGLGGSLPAREVYRAFRGRDASAEALLIDQGLKKTA